MKILFLNTSDISGGAARACYRIFKGVQKIEGSDVKLLVKNKTSDDFSVMTEKRMFRKILGQVKSILDILLTKLLKTGNKIIHSPAVFSSLDTKKIKNFNPNIIHLHWICGGFVSVADLKKIRKPIIWTLHDMWAFCGAEHYAKDTKRYVEGYTGKNRPKFEKGFDLNRWTWKRKMRNWKNLDLTIVTPSKWLAECARKSVLFKNKRIKVIPNGIDTSMFKPINKKTARDILNFPQDKKLILFGAMNATDDPRKGFKFIQEALGEIFNRENNENIELVVFGSSKTEKEIGLGFKINYLGKISDEVTLSLIYSSADLFVIPSLEDNLPNTIMESLSCGTPCVGFKVGGIPDMIEHKKNGYLAEYKNSKDLAKGIEWILSNKNYTELCQNARKKVVDYFDIKIIARKYKKLYEEILNNGNNA